jgi:phage host-nuclease inhibitor protein Gam
MKTTRIKIKLPTITTREEAEALMNELAQTVNNQRKMLADRDAEILAVNQDYEASLTECEAAITTKTETLRAWAEANPDSFPKGVKSIKMVSGVCGFRTGTPKLALLGRAFNWDKVLGLLKAASAWCNYVRKKEEVDKDAILGAHSNAKDKQQFDLDLKRFGIKVVQEESFFVEPDLSTFATRQTTEVP